MSRTWWFGVAVGVLLLTLGVAETVRVLMSGDLSGLAFWFGTLIGGGTCVLVGTVLAERRPVPAFALTAAGCVAGILPTMWTVVVPALLVTLLVLRAMKLRASAPAQPA
jgi:hypothetical protein